MKPKGFTVVLVFASAVFLAPHTAQAFYNPSTGRWLSRDPIEEKGGANIYAFLRNSPVNDFDAFGMCGDDDGVCDKEVQRPLNRVLDEVMTYFNLRWNRSQKAQVCNYLVGLSTAAGAWDIRELRHKGADEYQGCDRQVTFEGRCYFGGAVNYALFGKAMQKCNAAFPYDVRHTHSAMIAAIIKHKVTVPDGGGINHPEAGQALVFGNYGWHYLGSSPTGGNPLWPHFTCAPDGNTDTRTYAWRLRPLKKYD